MIDDLRTAAEPDRPVPDTAKAYTDTVRRHAYRTTDAQFEEMRDAGLSEDEIFELTVATAVGAGLARLDAGLRAMQ